MPYAVRLYALPSLFAGKLHAVLCRGWQQRVKGRDLYDYVWYLSRGVPVDLGHLQNRLVQTGHWEAETPLTLAALQQLLTARFHTIDFAAARRDVLPFIKRPELLELWGEDFFCSITGQLREAAGAAGGTLPG